MKNLLLKNPFYLYLENKFTQWLDTLGYTSSTVKEAPSFLREFLYFLEQNKVESIKNINNCILESYFKHLSTRKNSKNNGSLSINYLRSHLRNLRWFSKYMSETTGKGFDTEILIQSPEELPKIIFTKTEIKALYSATCDDVLGCRDRAMLSVYYGCGLRRNEGVNLDIQDVILGKNLLYVRKGKNYKQRYIPMDETVKNDLHNWVTQARPLLIKPEFDNNALFISTNGQRLTGNSLYNRLKLLMKAAKIAKPAGLHTLRHSIATHLLSDGLKINHIATFLGHESLENTQIYTHLVNEQLIMNN